MRCRGLLAMALLLFAQAVQAGNVAVRVFECNVADLDRAVDFFTSVLQFVPTGRDRDGTRSRAHLQLGEESVLLIELRTPAIAEQVNLLANDGRFQHIAIVVSDMDAAYQRLLAAHAAIVSSGPQTLPEWNYDAAGIRALYFQDPDGHFLELIQFPANKGEPKWHRRDGGLFLGIDHSAIVVRDVEASLRYYRDTLGLTLTGRSLNYGAEQDALNGLHGSKVKIASLRGVKGPGIELLQYLQPQVANSDTIPLATNGTLRWQIGLTAPRARMPDGATGADPDGHALRFMPAVGVLEPLAFAAEAARQHWPRYLMEGAQLGIFMIVTLYLTLALEHPASPLRRALPSDLSRRMLMGLGIAGTVIALIHSDWGRLSGAQFNPSVTLAFLSLGRIEPWDAAFYVLAQFAGGWLGLRIAAVPVSRAAAQKQVNHVLTLSGNPGIAAAFAAEFGIAFLLMFSLLNVLHQPALKPWIGVIAGLHLWAFIAFEAPVSGMSLNPARSAASALVAGDFRQLWIYFLAPPLAMLAAAQLCRHLIDS